MPRPPIRPADYGIPPGTEEPGFTGNLMAHRTKRLRHDANGNAAAEWPRAGTHRVTSKRPDPCRPCPAPAGEATPRPSGCAPDEARQPGPVSGGSAPGSVWKAAPPAPSGTRGESALPAPAGTRRAGQGGMWHWWVSCASCPDDQRKGPRRVVCEGPDPVIARQLPNQAAQRSGAGSNELSGCVQRDLPERISDVNEEPAVLDQRLC